MGMCDDGTEYCRAEPGCFPVSEFESFGNDRVHRPPGRQAHEATTGHSVTIHEATIVRANGPDVAAAEVEISIR